MHKISIKNFEKIGLIFVVFWRYTWNRRGRLRRLGQRDKMGGNNGQRT